MQKHIIWSNESLDIEDWRDDYREFLEINEISDKDADNQDDIAEYMHETNNRYLDDERMNLNIQLSRPIIVIADLGLWYGRVPGFKEISTGNIADCLYDQAERLTWYVDQRGDMRCTASHHDGTNYYLYRVYKDNMSDIQIENFKQKIYDGTATRKDITRYTKRLGDEIAKVYGWQI